MKNFNFIKSHEKTKEIKYPAYQESFDYVDYFFPSALVKEIKIYLCDHKLLFDIGLGKSLGFYSPISKIIIIANPDTIKEKSTTTLLSSIRAKISLDETIVHELLHYASNITVKGYITRRAEEEFAYGYSVKYLINKGHSKKDIINNNFMPYLISIVNSKKIKNRILKENGYIKDDFLRFPSKKRKKILKELEPLLFKSVVSEARKIGKKIIKKYIDKKPEPIEESNSDFDLMNLL